MGRTTERAASYEAAARGDAAAAEGRDVVNLAVGEPSFPSPPVAVDAARAAALDVRFHHYTPAEGLDELRAAIAAYESRALGYEVAPEQVLVSNGSKQAIFNTFLATLDPGAEVMLPVPYWHSYVELVRLAGGRAVFVAPGGEPGSPVTVDDLERAATPATTALVLNSPANPTGTVYRAEEVDAIARWAASRDVLLLADELYRGLTYGVDEPAVGRAAAAAAGTVVVANGVSKRFAMTGWRVGWVVGPVDLVRKAGAIQSHTSSNVSNVAQAAALAALGHAQEHALALRDGLERRRDVVLSSLASVDGVECPLPSGGLYAFPRVARRLERPVAGETPADGAALADVLLRKAGVVVVPGSAFGAPGHIRVSFGVDEAALGEGMRRLAAVLR